MCSADMFLLLPYNCHSVRASHLYYSSSSTIRHQGYSTEHWLALKALVPPAWEGTATHSFRQRSDDFRQPSEQVFWLSMLATGFTFVRSSRLPALTCCVIYIELHSIAAQLGDEVCLDCCPEWAIVFEFGMTVHPANVIASHLQMTRGNTYRRSVDESRE